VASIAGCQTRASNSSSSQDRDPSCHPHGVMNGVPALGPALEACCSHATEEETCLLCAVDGLRV
jgi:hypothetical protein